MLLGSAIDWEGEKKGVWVETCTYTFTKEDDRRGPQQLYNTNSSNLWVMVGKSAREREFFFSVIPFLVTWSRHAHIWALCKQSMQLHKKIFCSCNKGCVEPCRPCIFIFIQSMDPILPTSPSTDQHITQVSLSVSQFMKASTLAGTRRRGNQLRNSYNLVSFTWALSYSFFYQVISSIKFDLCGAAPCMVPLYSCLMKKSFLLQKLHK